MYLKCYLHLTYEVKKAILLLDMIHAQWPQALQSLDWYCLEEYPESVPMI